MITSNRYIILARVIGTISLLLALFFIVSLAVALNYNENLFPFIVPLFLSVLCAAVLLPLHKEFNSDLELRRKDAYFIVAFSWLTMSLIGSLPFWVSNDIPVYIDALFESVSGFTTTGSSILNDIESLPKSILFWRSTTHWIGGIGIILLVIVVLPSLHISSYQLFTLESSLQEKIKPQIKSVGYSLLAIYSGLTLIQTAVLSLGGMSFFDSICHAFGTVATGGFSPKNTSLAEYSPFIQYTTMLFMVLAGINFTIHYFILKGNFTKVLENEELRLYLTVIAVLGFIIMGILYNQQDKPFETAFREAFFQVISIVTCTGFSSADYLTWPSKAWILLFAAMMLGGSTGSTSGGIKMARHLLVLKNLKKAIRHTVSPNIVMSIKINNRHVSDDSNISILSFVALYIIIFSISTILLAFTGLDAKTASSAAATCMAGIGPGIGTIGPAANFAHLPPTAKILLTFLMLLGRLELYTILILFTRNYWVKYS